MEIIEKISNLSKNFTNLKNKLIHDKDSMNNKDIIELKELSNAQGINELSNVLGSSDNSRLLPDKIQESSKNILLEEKKEDISEKRLIQQDPIKENLKEKDIVKEVKLEGSATNNQPNQEDKKEVSAFEKFKSNLTAKGSCLEFTLLKYLNLRFINSGITSQILGYYIFMLIIFLSAIIYFLMAALDRITYTQVFDVNRRMIINYLIDPQKRLELNFSDTMERYRVQDYLRDMILVKLYTMELVEKHDAIVVNSVQNSLFKPESLRNLSMYSSLNEIQTQIEGKSFTKTNFTIINKLTDKFIYHENRTNLIYNPHMLLPFYWLMIPNFFELNKFYHNRFKSFTFLSYEANFDVNSPKYCKDVQSFSNTYFKYPVNDLDMTQSTNMSNFDIHNSMKDPSSFCFSDNPKYNGQKEQIEALNWHINLEKVFIKNSSIQSTEKILTLFRNIEDTDNTQSDIFNVIKKDDKGFIYSFVFEFESHNFEVLNTQSVLNNTFEKDYVVKIINFPYQISSIDTTTDYFIKTFSNQYNIDESKDLLQNIPSWMEKMYRYSLVPKNKYDNKSPSQKSYLDTSRLTTDKMLNYLQEDYINEYYRSDSILFTIIYFLNKLEQSKLFKSPKKCLISDIGSYYSYLNKHAISDISSKVPIDCIKERCKFDKNEKCEKVQSSVVNKDLDIKDPQNMYPFCYCYPLYCYDNQTTNIPEKFQFIRNATSLQFPDKCKVKLFSKSPNSTDNFFFIQYSGRNLFTLTDNVIVFTLHLTETIFLEYFYSDQKQSLDNINNWILITLLPLLIFIGILMVKFLGVKTDKLSSRMNEMNDIQKIAIKENSLSNNNLHENDENNENSNKNNNESERIKKIKKELNEEKLEENQNLTNSNTIKANYTESDEQGFNQQNIDELDDVNYLINENLYLFNIDFDISQNLHENNPLVVSFIQELKMKIYFDQMLPESIKELSLKDEEEVPLQEENSNHSNIAHNLYTKIDNIKRNLNAFILYELLSTEMINFDNYKQNFFYKEKNDHLFNYYEEINYLLYDDEIEFGEVTNTEKIKKFMGYFKVNIHKPWMLKYEKSLQKFS